MLYRRKKKHVKLFRLDVREGVKSTSKTSVISFNKSPIFLLDATFSFHSTVIRQPIQTGSNSNMNFWKRNERNTFTMYYMDTKTIPTDIVQLVKLIPIACLTIFRVRLVDTHTHIHSHTLINNHTEKPFDELYIQIYTNQNQFQNLSNIFTDT